MRLKKSTALRGLKPLEFVGSSRDDLCAMPAAVRHSIGLELMRVQYGAEPTNFKSMPTVGAGAYEIRIRDESGAYRAIYVAKFEAAVYVLQPSKRRRGRHRRRTSSWRRPDTD